MDKSKFIQDINGYIQKSRTYYDAQKNAITCDNIFDCSDLYVREQEYLGKILSQDFKTTTEQGNLLESLIKLLFQRIQLIQSVEVTNKDTTIGQIDIQLITIDDIVYDVLGMINDKPQCMIGECKNYSKKKDTVGREEIEKMCWRSCKGGCLSFFIGYGYTQKAIDEIAFFNNSKSSICCKHQGVFIVPLTLSMIEAIIQNKMNFCYFIKWSIAASRIMSIANYLGSN